MYRTSWSILLSRLHAFLVIGLLGLTACGFEPLYGDQEQGTPTEDLLSQVSVPPLEGRLGQLVRIELTNRLTPKPAPAPVYTVNVELTKSKQGLAVRRDATATRANLIISATFALTFVGETEKLTSGVVRSSNGYDILRSDFATLAAENDARRRGARDVANEIVSRIAIFLSRAAKQTTAPTQR